MHGAVSDVFGEESQVGSDSTSGKAEVSGDFGAVNLEPFLSLFDSGQGSVKYHTKVPNDEDQGSFIMSWFGYRLSTAPVPYGRPIDAVILISEGEQDKFVLVAIFREVSKGGKRQGHTKKFKL